MSQPNTITNAAEVLAQHLWINSPGTRMAADQLRRALSSVPAGVQNVQVATAMTALLSLSGEHRAEVGDAMSAMAKIAERLGI